VWPNSDHADVNGCDYFCMSLSSDLARLGGLARRSKLLALGHSPYELRRFVASGAAEPLRRSWLVTPSANPLAVRAVALGGVLGGESALRSLGVWVSGNGGLCVVAPPTASRLPALAPGEYRLRPHDFSWPAGWRTGAVAALDVLTRRVTTVHAIASIDSALHGGLMPPEHLDALFARLPRRYRALRPLLNGRCESGIESILRVAAQLAGWHVDVQVMIPGIGRVDLLINGWLIIEADGDSWHSSRQQRARDRARDAAAVRRGMRSHRFGHEQIMGDLEGCIEVIRSYLLAGRPR
jgi:very-short-patch-repair endonuclease